MKCGNAQRQLTLHVSGDLPSDKAVLLERHLDGCKRCCAFRDELALQRELLAELNATPVVVPEPDFARIIQKHDRLALGGLSWRQRFAGLVVASLTLAICVAWTWAPEPAQETTRLSKLAPMPQVESTVTHAVEKPAETAKPELVDAAEDAPPTVMKLYTDDPDVVIYWFGD